MSTIIADIQASHNPGYIPVESSTKVRSTLNGPQIYVAGPMRGYAKYNFPAFDRAANYLRGQGWRVLSPAEHDRGNGFNPELDLEDQAFDLHAAFRWDVECILAADAIYMLKDWEASTGATTEHAIAVAIGLRRIYEAPQDLARYEYEQHIARRRMH